MGMDKVIECTIDIVKKIDHLNALHLWKLDIYFRKEGVIILKGGSNYFKNWPFFQKKTGHLFQKGGSNYFERRE